MNFKIPHRTEYVNGRPRGLYRRYKIEKANTELDGADDPDAQYFVLRLDSGGDDYAHVKACQRAALEYANQIRPHNPDLADDVVRLVAACTAETVLKDIIGTAYWRQTIEKGESS